MTAHIRRILVTKMGRNDPCQCGSGIKAKRCCMFKPYEDRLRSLRKWLKAPDDLAWIDQELNRISTRGTPP